MPALYVVPTPIGNLRDITLRALDVLTHCHVVYAEDTRVASRLLQAYALNTKIARYDEHVHDAVSGQIIQAIQNGQIVALISDAGTPAISDPGQYLVQACRAANVTVIALPGASAMTTALSGAGLRTNSFSFIGFLPTKSKARQTLLAEWQARRETLVLFESPNRIAAMLNDVAAVMGPLRRIAIARELTKKFEEYLIGSVSDVQQTIDTHTHLKGEMVVLIEGNDNDAKPLGDPDIDALLRGALQTQSLRDAVQHVVAATGLKKQMVYQRALTLSGDDD